MPKPSDPVHRPQFTVGQRVRVTRAEENGWGSTFIGCEGNVLGTDTQIAVMLDGGMIVMSPWCLDAVTEPEQEIEMHVSMPRKVKARFTLKVQSEQESDQ